MGRDSLSDRLDALAVLQDPNRRELYQLVARADTSVSRDDAAQALELPRSTAAFHLDRLVDAGLLQVTYVRLTGRSGPGAGRPAKLYRACEQEVSASVPDRHYELLAGVLAAALAESVRTGAPASEVLESTAERSGRAIGAEAGRLEAALADQGFCPEAGSSVVTLRNCPFRPLAIEHGSVVCTANRALVAGILAGCGERAELLAADSTEGGCCVRLELAGSRWRRVRRRHVPRGHGERDSHGV